MLGGVGVDGVLGALGVLGVEGAEAGADTFALGAGEAGVDFDTAR